MNPVYSVYDIYSFIMNIHSDNKISNEAISILLYLILHFWYNNILFSTPY